MMGETLSQSLAIADVLNYQTVTNATVNTLGIDMSKFTRAIWYVITPSLGAAGTFNCFIQTCLNSNFNAGVHNIANGAIAQLLTASTPGNNAITTLEISSQAVTNANPGDKFARLQMIGGGNALTVAAVGLGGQAIQKPASQYNLNNVYVGATLVIT